MARAVQNNFQELLSISDSLVYEQDYLKNIEKIANFAKKTCNADACFFYTVNDNKYLSLEYSYIEKLNIKKFGSDNLAYFPTIYLPELKSKKSKTFIEQCAVNKEVVNCPNIYETSDLDLSLITKFDDKLNYNTISILVIPIISSKKSLVGVAAFLNAIDPNGKILGFNSLDQQNVQSICNLSSTLLENRRLKEDYVQLLESFIEVLARAIDAKSPYTGAHCQRVPIIARLLATAAVSDDSGKLGDFEMSEDNWYSLHIASWLHDCGKVTTPEYIVDKATKLETITNRIHEIRNRFEILRRDAHIDYLKKRLNNSETQENLQKEFILRVKKLEDDFSFIARCNTGDEPLKDEDVSRLDSISKTKFMRFFNRMLGLSWAERDHTAEENKEKYTQPAEETVLQDLPCHVFGGNNRGELYNLKINRGTINKEEREKINEHITVTIDMLKALPFPKELGNVVEYAGSHHERIDGKGYPNGLTGEQMSIPAKIMAIADIFEALTANDRPYKEPKKLSEVLKIMQNMKNTGHIDPVLFEIFIRQKVYKDYAEQYVDPSQIDEINEEEYL